MDLPINEWIQYGGKYFTIAFIILAGIAGQMAINRFLAFLRQGGYLSDPMPLWGRNLSRYIIFGVVLLFILQQTGVKVSSIINSLLAVAAMVAIGFIAVWSVFSNFLCALLLIIFSPFQVGDEIEITEAVGGVGLRGRVVDVSLMYTVLLETCDLPEEERPLVRIPNNIFFQKAVKRWKKGLQRKKIEKHLLNKSLHG